MNILVIAENWPPRVGGIERYITGIVTGLAAQPNVHITVIVPTNSEDIVHPNITIIRKRFFWPLLRPAWLPLYLFISRLMRQQSFDVVICTKALFEGLLGLYLQKKYNVPFIVCTYAMEINTWASAKHTRKKLVRVLAAAHAVITINTPMNTVIEKLGVEKGRIHTIYPTVDSQFLRRVQDTAAHAAVLQKYNLQKPYILSVARLVLRKGFDDVIRAFAMIDQMKFADVQLVIVGDGPARAMLEQVGEQEYVRPLFLGAVPDEDLPALFAGAHLFALTPKQIGDDVEGFGIVYLEAGAAGVPIVATDSGGVAEAVAEAGGGTLVQPGDVKAIAKAFSDLLTQETSREEHERPIQSSWENRAKQLINLLPKR